MADKMDPSDRAVLVAAQLATIVVKPGDDAADAVDAFASILIELRRRRGVTGLWKAAQKQKKRNGLKPLR